MRVTDHEAVGRPGPDQVAMVSAPLTSVWTDEFDAALPSLEVSPVELLSAALGRTLSRTVGDGVVAVDLALGAHSATPVLVRCAGPGVLDATELLAWVRDSLAAPIPAGAPDAVSLRYIPNATDPTPAPRVPLELRVYPADGLLQLEWWFDARCFDRATVEEFGEQFPFVLVELTSEAVPPNRTVPAAI